ncbi:MAG: hypothetical protein ACRDHW_12015, partial [Ktedonobacteraceae bacterium]
LLTTRFPILAHGFAGEHALHLRELTQDESLALLQQVAPQISQAQPADVLSLVQTVGGLPLALTLLGRYLHVQSLSGPPRRLAQTLRHLCEDMQARLQLEEPLISWTFTPSYAPGTAMSLRFAIDLSMQHLPAAAQTALAALAVFPPKPYTFAEEAALTVGAISTETLDLLVDSGLVEISLQGRYQLHQTIADYARLQESHPDPAVEQRFVEFVADFLKANQQDFSALEQDLHIITAALELATSKNMPAALLAGTFLLLPFLEHKRLYTLAETLLTQVQERALQLEDRQSQVRAWLWRGSLAELRGELRQAQQAYLTGLTLARQLQQRDLLAQMLVKTGGVLIKTAESWPQAEAYLIEGLHELEDLKEGVPYTPRSLIFQLLGQLAGSVGDSEKALAFYRRGLAMAMENQQWQIVSAILQNLGVYRSWQGNHAEAASYYQESFTYAQRTNDLQRQCALLM